jgi:hypothetical protein
LTPPSTPAVHTLIRVSDRDCDGLLDAGEYAQLTAVYGASAEEAARAFGQLDLDRSGAFDSAELSGDHQFFASRDAAPTATSPSAAFRRNSFREVQAVAAPPAADGPREPENVTKYNKEGR